MVGITQVSVRTMLVVLLALALQLWASTPLLAQTVIATVPVGRSPEAVAVNEKTNRIYVTNSFNNTVSVIQDSSCLGTGETRLRGRVRTAADPTGIPDVIVTLTGPGGCQDATTTNATGHYIFRTLGSGIYTVIPEKDGCAFTPPSRMVTLEEADPQANFSGTCPDSE